MDISKIDPNFKIEAAGTTGVTYYNYNEAPIQVHGLYDPIGTGKLWRMPEEYKTNEALNPEECLRMDINTAEWTLVDGYYYFNRILQPGESTSNLFTQVEIVGSQVDQTHVGSMLSITVDAQAVQSQNNPAENPWEALGWPADQEDAA